MDALEEEDHRQSREGEQAEEEEIIHESPQVRLLVEQGINRAIGLPGGGHGISVVQQQIFGGGKTRGEGGVGGGEMADHEGLMGLRAARKAWW